MWRGEVTLNKRNLTANISKAKIMLFCTCNVVCKRFPRSPRGPLAPVLEEVVEGLEEALELRELLHLEKHGERA